MDFSEIAGMISTLVKLTPFPAAQPVAWTKGGRLQTCLDPLKTDPDFTGMGIALVDLDHMAFAGVRERNQLYGASLVKIVAMFAAFALRERVRVAETTLPKMPRNELFKRLTGLWRPSVESAVSKKQKDFPNFWKIFSLKGPKVEFNDNFKRHLDLMITLSDNHAAAECIQRVGYQYINGALAAAGLFDTVGLWLAADYVADVPGYKDFHEIKVDVDANPKIHDKKGLTTQGATAEAVAKFLVLVDQGKLVNATASAEMKAIMTRQRLESDFKQTLQAKYTGVTAYGKIGIGYGVGDDCAVIERMAEVRASPRMEKRIRYVAVGLREPRPYNLKKLIVKLDECVVKHNAP